MNNVFVRDSQKSKECIFSLLEIMNKDFCSKKVVVTSH
jgi:hypothetical protein